MPDSSEPAFEELLAAGEAAPITGWDFSWLEGRATEERPSWGYSRMVAERLPLVSSALDIETGGGEVLAGVGPFPARMVATEPWPPNVPIAAQRLQPLGVYVVAHRGSELPFREESFDLVLCRHPVSTPWPSIARVLRPGGTFLSQQIGGDNVEDLAVRIRGPRPPGPKRGLERERAAAQAAGLEVIDGREESLRCVFNDVAAMVYFLRLVVWIVPGFNVDRYRSELRMLHDEIGANGPFVARSHRFLIEARKPE